MGVDVVDGVWVLLEGYGHSGDGASGIGSGHDHLVGQVGRLDVEGPLVSLGRRLGGVGTGLEGNTERVTNIA